MSRHRWRNRNWSRLRIPAVAAGAIAVIILLEATGLAAVGVPSASVIMKALSANLAFGKEQPAAAPSAPSADNGGFFESPFGADEAVRDFAVRSQPGAPVELCPEAGPTDFPDEPAGFDAKNPPKEGRYIWKESGEIDLIAPVPFTLHTGPFSFRTISNVTVAGDGSWRYDDAWSTDLVGTETDSILVVPVASATQNTSAGIYLTALHFHPTSGSDVDFTPLRPVLLIGLPVTRGAAVGSPVPYVDITHQRSMTFQGQVDKPQRFDACGTVIEAWQITGAQRIVTSVKSDGPHAEDQSTTFNFAIAPHLGGLIVALHRKGSGAVGPFTFQYDTTSSIGTLDPRPLPKSAQ